MLVDSNSIPKRWKYDLPFNGFFFNNNFFLVFQVEFYTMFLVRCAAITVQANTTAFSLVMDVLVSSKDQFVDRAIMCARQKVKENVLWTKHIGISVELAVCENASTLE